MPFKLLILLGVLMTGSGCAGRQLVIGAAGDVLVHAPVLVQGYQRPEGFASLWAKSRDQIAAADIFLVDLELPSPRTPRSVMYPEDQPFSNANDHLYQRFPYPELLRSIAKAGVDVISTGTNHALDFGPAGIDRKLRALEAENLLHMGTRLSSEPGPRADKTWHVLARKNGWTVAFIACTYNTNRRPDTLQQVLYCWDNKELLLGEISRLARQPGVDAVVVMPHWGDREYSHSASPRVRELAREMADHGALAVLGSHPHAVQPWERYRTPDGRETLLAYSLGNFISHQTADITRLGALIYVKLVKDSSGKARIHSAESVPLWMEFNDGMYAAQPLSEGKNVPPEMLNTYRELMPPWCN